MGHKNLERLYRTPSINDQCRSIPIKILALIWNTYWSAFGSKLPRLQSIPINSDFRSMLGFWLALIGIGHWSRHSCISYVQSSGQLILWTQLLSTQACNHMNAKKGIQLLLLMAIQCHTTESVCFLSHSSWTMKKKLLWNLWLSDRIGLSSFRCVNTAWQMWCPFSF